MKKTTRIKTKASMLIFFLLIASALVNAAGFLELLSKKSTEYIVAGWIISSLRTVQVFFDSSYDNLAVLILANPKIENFAPGMAFFMSLVVPFYLLGITTTALYVLFFSGSPEGRTKAKSNLTRMLYSLVLLSLCPILLNLLFTFSSTTAGMIMNMVDKKMAIDTIQAGTDLFYEITVKVLSINPGGEAGAFFGAVLTATYYINYILPLGRLVFITFLSMLMPFSVFLYSFYSTRSLGKKLVQQLLIITLIQVAWAVAIATIAMSKAMLIQYTNVPQNHIEWLSYVIFIASPAVILGTMDWFGFIVIVVDSTTTGPLCVGPVVMDELYSSPEILPEEVTEDVSDI